MTVIAASNYAVAAFSLIVAQLLNLSACRYQRVVEGDIVCSVWSLWSVFSGVLAP